MSHTAGKVLTRLRSTGRKLLTAPLNALALWANRVRTGDGVRIRGYLRVLNRGTLRIGTNAVITSSGGVNPVGGRSRTFLYVGPGATLDIGNNAGISNAVVYAQREIRIGEDVLLGGGVQVYDSDFHALAYDQRMQRPDTNVRTAPVHIQRGCFVGAGAIILKGVTIGEYSIIGAGSVVTKNVPPGEIWAGNPARSIGKAPTTTASLAS